MLLALAPQAAGLTTEAAAEPGASAPAAAVEYARQQAEQAYAEARRALDEKRWFEAELLLERALMFHPGHVEAMLQLALLLAERGQAESARALLATLLRDFDVPPAQRERLQALLRNPATGTAATSLRVDSATPHTLVGFSLGRSSNPLVVSSARELQLSLPQGDLVVPILSRARAGTLGQSRLYRRWDNGLELQAVGQFADVPGASAAGRLDLVGRWPGAATPSALRWGLSAQRSLDGARRHAASLFWSPGGAVGGPAMLYGLSLYDEPASGRRGWSARVQQPVQARTGPQLAWGEYEHATSGGPGALRAGWQAQWPLPAGWALHSHAYGQLDTSGYSPLLKNHARRRLFTLQLVAEHALPAPPWGGQFVLQLHWGRRWSNLPLFGWTDHGITLAWHRTWP